MLAALTPVLHVMTVLTPVLYDDHLNSSTECDDRVIYSATCDGCPNPSVTPDIYTLPCGNSSSESIYSLSTNPEATINVTPGLTPSRFPSDTCVTSPRNILFPVLLKASFQHHLLSPVALMLHHQVFLCIQYQLKRMLRQIQLCLTGWLSL